MNGLIIYKKLIFFYYKYIVIIMTELFITDYKINKFINCNPLKITQLIIYAVNDIELVLNNLHKFINLQKLCLYNNQIKEIKYLNNLVNLQELDLDNNKITEIKGLDNLVNLQKLGLSKNQITEIKGLDNLVNLQKLYLCENKITEIKGLDNLVNLQTLYLSSNQITEIPIILCNFRNINNFYYIGNPIDHISLPVQRWLTRNRNNNIYNDGQNIHNHNIQSSFINSLTNLLKDKLTIDLETVKNEIINNEILTEQTKREIFNYCDDPTEHSIYLITYSDLLIYVWSRIRNKDEILKILNQEISDGLCMCFTGRMTRLLNVLVGFYDDIELQISDSEQITNIIISLKNKYNDEQLKDAVKKELLERQYSEAIINEWLEYI